jgi:hypothetical protein
VRWGAKDCKDRTLSFIHGHSCSIASWVTIRFFTLCLQIASASGLFTPKCIGQCHSRTRSTSSVLAALP